MADLSALGLPELTAAQVAVAQAPRDAKIFLEGIAGTGKTTAGAGRLLHLLTSGVPADRVLILVPQRTLADPYYRLLQRVDFAGGTVNVATIGGLARRMVDLFWPLLAEEAGFKRPDAPPVFLTLETAQYYMARVVAPLVETQGYFESITVDRNRVYSQIIDNLNKAAVIGFPHTEIAERLKGAWVGEQAQSHVYDQAQECAVRFRNYCLEHNLLDFSLQVELFSGYLWPAALCRNYLFESYPHIIVDNTEEDIPVAHDMIYTWLPSAASALVLFDHDAGYRSFLGADPESGTLLREMCGTHHLFTDSFVTPAPVQRLGAALRRILDRAPAPEPPEDAPEDAPEDVRAALRFAYHRYYPEMLDWVAGEIASLVEGEGVPPGEIVVLAPFLTDALRFSLAHRLERHGIPSRSHRPSRALRDEPATRCLLTLAALAHPAWGDLPTRYDVTYALMQSIDGLDLVRAQLLADIVYRVRDGLPSLAPFEGINADVQERITYLLGGRYEALRAWLAAYAEGEPIELDHFLARLFGECLSQPGYGFHRDLDAARVAATLVESVQKFRWVAQELVDDKPLGQEYLEMVRSGVIAAQYVGPWQEHEEDAVLLAPAYTFLLSNRPVAVQFWLNVGGSGWWERLYQPLTHPYVLSRRWPKGRPWTDVEEFALRQTTLRRLTLGLVRRCRTAVYLGLSEFGEQGFEQQGPLLQAIQRVLRDLPSEFQEGGP